VGSNPARASDLFVRKDAEDKARPGFTLFVGSNPARASDLFVRKDAEDKARPGFEPGNDGFANRCLSQLGDRASMRGNGALYA
jgi:hypothetical protein